MWRLHHYQLCPFSRKIRLVLAEYRLDFDLIAEKPWERSDDLLALNPASQTPVLTHDDDERVLADSCAIFEYLFGEYGADAIPLLGANALGAAEARRLAAWFDIKFHDEVTRHAFGEMVFKRFIEKAPPEGRAIRAAKHNLDGHMAYIDYLFDRRSWLAGDSFSIADICAAAQLSIMDYFGLVRWDKHRPAKDWYSRIKSRPSMRPILADRLAGLKPAAHYDQLDF
ncbi:MAG: glutathione S-transferase family protein [Pseudomonadota bacterium]